jgi:hypothetical protein
MMSKESPPQAEAARMNFGGCFHISKGEAISCILLIPPPAVLKFLREKGKRQISLKTSLSDNQVYPDFCLKASNDMLIFSNFRQNVIYRSVLEHVDEKTGQLYLFEIKKIRNELLNSIDKIKEAVFKMNPTCLGQVHPELPCRIVFEEDG